MNEPVEEPNLTLKICGNQWYWNYSYGAVYPKEIQNLVSSFKDEAIFSSYRMSPDSDVKKLWNVLVLRHIEFDSYMISDDGF